MKYPSLTLEENEKVSCFKSADDAVLSLNLVGVDYSAEDINKSMLRDFGSMSFSVVNGNAFPLLAEFFVSIT